MWQLNDLHFQQRRNKAPLTCCSDYWKYKDARGQDFDYCSIYLVDPDTAGNILPGELNGKIFKKVSLDSTVKFLNFCIPENFAVIYLKFKQAGQILEYFVKMIQME